MPVRAVAPEDLAAQFLVANDQAIVALRTRRRSAR